MAEYVKKIDEVVTIIEKEIAADDWTLHSDADGVQLYVKTVPESPIQAVKCIGLVNYNAEKLVDRLYSLSLAEWQKLDDALVVRDVVENIDDDNQIVYQRSSLPWPIWHRDMANVFGKRKRADGGAILAFCSIEHPKAPEDPKNYVRALTPWNAFVCVPEGDKTRLYRLACINPAGSLPSAIVNAKISGVRTIVGLINQHLHE